MNIIRNIGLLEQIYQSNDRKDESAVYIRNAHKAYGRGKNAKQILKGLNVTVERGSIYGLLGASGCGKTTLLNCIVGRNLLNAGELWVLGGTPGTEGSGVPGPRVGYMPQETALIQELTVFETIKFFGRICSMEDDKILVKFKELANLLDLPPAGQLVGTLSGGQQRRVSFAAALVHEPELLILDEPTVGLDPILRHKIWEHLIEVTNTQKTTVIITTHYIEECRQAHKVGLMRQGKLLADGNPEDIIAQYGTDNLEDVFLHLSKEQNAEKLAESTTQSTENIIPQSKGNSSCSLNGIEILDKEQEKSIKDHKKHKKRTRQAKIFRAFTIEHERLKSLFLKNMIQISRNKLGIGMIFLFPILQTCLFFFCIGGDPIDLPVAIVNDEKINCLNKNFTDYLNPTNETDCDFQFLSCKFIEDLDEDRLIKKEFYPDIDTGIAAVEKGYAHGVVYFPKEYTNFLKNLAFGNIIKDNNETFELGKLQVWLDMSNLQFGPRIKLKLITKFIELQKSLLKTCHYNPHAGNSPIKMEKAIYGISEGSYLVFCLPGTLVTLSFFLMTMATSSVLVEERTEGIWDRILVAGATTAEVLVNHILTQFVIALITTAEVLILTYAVFNFAYAGHILNLTGILLSQCLCGMCFGFMVSSIAKNFTAINSLSGGIFLPMTIVSGVMWPLEGMPTAVRQIAFALPFAFSVEAFRNVSMKGWGITNPGVYIGYLLPLAWSFIYILLTFYFLKRKM